MRFEAMEIDIGDVVLVERKYRFYEAEVLEVADSPKTDILDGKGLYRVRYLKRWFHKTQWVRGYNIEGKIKPPASPSSSSPG
jgi:hypothetical protein